MFIERALHFLKFGNPQDETYYLYPFFGQISILQDNLFIAKDENVTRDLSDRIFAKLKITFGLACQYYDIKDIRGELKWTVKEFDKIRMFLLHGAIIWS